MWATAQLPGFHHWPDAPDHRAYLRDRHRHLFHLRAEVSVSHDDRDVEFHDLSDWLRRIWHDRAPDGEWGPKSCEAIARELAAAAGWMGRSWSMSVSEDGESGAVVSGYGRLSP